MEANRREGKGGEEEGGGKGEPLRLGGAQRLWYFYIMMQPCQ